MRPRQSSRVTHAPRSTAGRTIYAVGDIHGRADLLAGLMRRIDADNREPDAGERPVLIFLGDYVDRGPDAREVIDMVAALQDSDRYEVRLLKGNHEAAMLEFLADPGFGPVWARYGGLDTLASYGVALPTRATGEAWEAARSELSAALPERHTRLLNNLELMAEYGDYLFVHAGVRPGVLLEDQTEEDLLWIRDDFLEWRGSFGRIVVHGHTPEPHPVISRNRIGIDTGAYATGTLTAVRLSGDRRVLLQSQATRHRSEELDKEHAK